jgi:hypothetical protein
VATESRKHPLIDHLVEGRTCGTCIACCKIPKIDELDKPMNVLCRHCTGTACGIYAERPDVCRQYYCLWRRIEAMPAEARPDRIGIMFALEMRNPARTPFERMYIIARPLASPSAFDTPYGQAAMNMFIREGSLPVFIGIEGTKRLVYPDAEFSNAILDPVSTPHRELVPAALEWRKKYGMT